MKRVIFSTHGIKTDHEVRITLEDELESNIRIFKDFCDIEVATTDIEIARITGIDYFDGINFHKTTEQNFYANVPEWLKEKHEAIVAKSLRVSLATQKQRVTDLEDLDLRAMTEEGGVYVIHAPTGHKKTQTVARPMFASAVNNGKKVTAITPLISICKSFHQSAVQDTGKEIAYYEELTEADLNNLGMITTINSSAKPSILNHSQQSEVVIIEEFCASLDVVAESKELRSNRREIWESLKKTLAETKTVFLLDADFNENYIEFIRESGREPKVIEIAPDYSDITVDIHEKGHLISRLLDDAKAGKKLLVTTDSKRTAEQINKLLNGVEGVMMIHAENKGQDRHREFLNNPNDNLDGVNVLIYTPVMNRSISIEKEYFEGHFALFRGVITPVSCIQQMRRDRTARKFDICIDSFNRIGCLESPEEFECEDVVMKKIRESNRYLRNSISTSLPITMGILGFNVSKVEYEEAHGRAGVRALNSARRELKDEYNAGVKAAKDIDIHEAEARLKMDHLSTEEILERDSRLIRSMTGEISDSAIDFYGEGAGYQKMRLLEIINMSEAEALRIDGEEKRLPDFDKTHAEFIRKEYRHIFKFIECDGVYQFDEAQALRIVNHLKRLKTTNKTGIVRLETKQKYTEAIAVKRVTEMIKALGFTVRTRKDKYGEKVKRVENVENVRDFFMSNFGKPLSLAEPALIS